ncbi:CCA tRNA nucleotidyltransferase [Haloplasma contractile]|uniref:tRNA nucleotidyltransferase CCA-adding enzyme protein n=1 Tax=Haloplasma contractile SSD-17B TaxID=1033810 RepID=F7PVN9_9MOLU|nr:CCA tRNA nucleotidyltransferase [Haloplasma contractile]ERJ12790.1 tRNA nucleotidyltransferase CCA-adding enzyme protein [Haloplasma contractile SSD-17B]
MKKLEIAKEILTRFTNHGYEAYIVGGFVRDRLLGIKSEDIDIATSATPDDVINLFPKHIPTGLKHGTITVIHQNFSYEITTFRKESRYVNNRKPLEVEYIKDFEGDLRRRDFTINALAMTRDETIIDYVNGQKDLHNKVIRAVGDSPDERFKEDALRILRAFRFSSRLGFDIEEATLKGMKNQVHLLKNISQERIFKELNGLLQGKYAKKSLRNMVIAEAHDYIPHIGSGILKMVEYKGNPGNLIELLAISLTTEGFGILDDIKLSNKIKTISKLAAEMYLVGIDVTSPIYLFRNGLDACLVANRLNVILDDSDDLNLKIKATYKELPIKKVCDLAFKGDDIIALYNRKPGGWIGDLIDDISYKVLLGELKNEQVEIKNYLLKKSL